MAGIKHHVNPETGRTNQCKATVKDCKFAVNGMVPEHYDTKEEARAAYEKRMEAEQSSTTGLKKSGAKKKRELSEREQYIKEAREEGYDEDYANDLFDKQNRVGKYRYPDDVKRDYDRSMFKNFVSVNDYARQHKIVKRTVDSRTGGVSVHIEGIEYDNGVTELINPDGSPDGSWHDDEIRYVETPNLDIVDRQAFTKSFLKKGESNNSSWDKNPIYLENNISRDTLDRLDQAGFFDTNNYEARIVSDWYGEEFHGWDLKKSVKDKLTPIITDEIIGHKTKLHR